ncbi:MAG: tetratricopeptide repeat protein [Deltaproteobacteria bacterium]|nr:tetratricopeptide repeat protein [Deltaproteobacteria bacterium]
MRTAKRIFYALTALAAVALSVNSFAAEKVFIREYTYQASEIDSKVTSRAQALEQAKRLVLEELGTYLMSKTEVKDFAITSDKITVFTAGVVQIEIFDEKWNGEKYYLKARIKADPVEVAKAIDRLRKDDVKTKELEESKRRADEALKDIVKLKAELDTVKNDRSKQLAYAKQINTMSATEWFKKGWAFGNSGDWDNAIEAYSEAIELDPYYARAYSRRGFAYGMKHQYDRAIEDYNKVISLEPGNAGAYWMRGSSYYNYNKGQNSRSLADYKKACELNRDITPFCEEYLR